MFSNNQSHELRAVTLNAWGLPLGLAKDKSRRMKNIGVTIAHSKYDLIGLQEIWDPRDVRPLVEGARAAGLHFYHHYLSGVTGSGLLLLSRYPMDEVGFRRFRLSGSAETIYHGDYIAGKGIGFARVQTPMGGLDVYLLHTVAQYEPDDRDDYLPHRVAQLFEAAQYINTKSSGNPIIMMGDFNVRTDQLGYRLFTSMTGARNCYAERNPGDACITYDPVNPYLPNDAWARGLDYLFARNGDSVALMTTTAEIVFRSLPVAMWNGSQAAYSDHYGVAAQLTMRPQSMVTANGKDKLIPALTELTQRLDEGLKAAQARSKAHRRKILRGGSALLPAALLSRALGRWAFALFMPVILLYTIVGALLAYVTVPHEIGDMKALLREAKLVRQQLVRTHAPEKHRDAQALPER